MNTFRLSGKRSPPGPYWDYAESPPLFGKVLVPALASPPPLSKAQNYKARFCVLILIFK